MMDCAVVPPLPIQIGITRIGVIYKFVREDNYVLAAHDKQVTKLLGKISPLFFTP